MDPSDPVPEALQQHAGFLRALAIELTDQPAAADDVSQDVWVAMLETPPRGKNLRAWMRTVTRRVIARHDRTRRRREQREVMSVSPQPLPATADVVSDANLLRRVTDAVIELDDPYRKTILQRYYTGLTAAQIAERERIPASTVRSHLKRALDRLRRRLDDDFGDRETWSACILALVRWPDGLSVAARGGALKVGGLAVSTGTKAAVGIGVVVLALIVASLRREFARPERALTEQSTTDLQVVGAPVGSGSSASTASPFEESIAPIGLEDSRNARGPSTVCFTILESDGVANADMLTVLVEAKGRRTTRPTDERGLVRFPVSTERALLIIERRSAPPHWEELVAMSQDRTIRLPLGAELSGTITVDGHPPVDPLALTLYPTATESSTTVWNSDRAIAMTSQSPPAYGVADAAGTFKFMGLDSSWSGKVRFPRGYARAGTRAENDPYQVLEFFVPRPTRGLQIAVERYPSLRGALVRPDGNPACRGVVEAQVTWEDGTATSIGARSGEEGEFEVFLRQPVRSITARYWEEPGRRGECSLTVGREYREGGDLGSLSLGASEVRTLRVNDTEGRPVVGAVTNLESSPTDSRGVTELEGLTASTDTFWLAAQGYVTRKIVVDELLADELVVMEPTNELRITVLEDDGSPASGVAVELESDGAIFLGESKLPSWLQRRFLVGDYFSATTSGGTTLVDCRADARGQLSATEVQTNAAITVRLLSDLGQILVEQVLSPLGSSERREVELQLPPGLCSFKGRVLDHTGLPLSGASLLGGSTDPHGHFSFARILPTNVQVQIEKKGYRPLVLEDYPVCSLAGDAEFRLMQGRDVAVLVVDDHDRVVSGGSIRASWDETDETWQGRSTGDGRYSLSGLPDGEVDITLRLAGADYDTRHDARIPEVQFRVPVHGAVTAEWDHEGDAEWAGWIRIVLQPDGEVQGRQSYRAHGRPRGVHTFDQVLPGRYSLFATTQAEDRALGECATVDVRAGKQERSVLP